MRREITISERREATHIAGEMTAHQLFSMIHERFEFLRERDGLTKHDVAIRLGVSDQLVSRWMSEPRNITVKSAGRLLAALDAHLGFEVDCYEDVNAHNQPVADGPSNRLSAVRSSDIWEHLTRGSSTSRVDDGPQQNAARLVPSYG